MAPRLPALAFIGGCWAVDDSILQPECDRASPADRPRLMVALPPLNIVAVPRAGGAVTILRAHLSRALLPRWEIPVCSHGAGLDRGRAIVADRARERCALDAAPGFGAGWGRESSSSAGAVALRARALRDTTMSVFDVEPPSVSGCCEGG